MYHFTLTSKSFPAHTVIAVALSHVDSDGTRLLLMHENRTIPLVQGELFEMTPAEFLQLTSAHVAGISEKWIILTSNNDIV